MHLTLKVVESCQDLEGAESEFFHGFSVVLFTSCFNSLTLLLLFFSFVCLFASLCRLCLQSLENVKRAVLCLFVFSITILLMNMMYLMHAHKCMSFVFFASILYSFSFFYASFLPVCHFDRSFVRSALSNQRNLS